MNGTGAGNYVALDDVLIQIEGKFSLNKSFQKESIPYEI